MEYNALTHHRPNSIIIGIPGRRCWRHPDFRHYIIWTSHCPGWAWNRRNKRLNNTIKAYPIYCRAIICIKHHRRPVQLNQRAPIYVYLSAWHAAKTSNKRVHCYNMNVYTPILAPTDALIVGKDFDKLVNIYCLQISTNANSHPVCMWENIFRTKSIFL